MKRTTTVAIASLAFALAACSGQTKTAAPSTVTVTQPPQSTYAVATPAAPPTQVATTTAAASSQLTIPEVSGQNAEIVRKKLENMGLTDVSLSSANPKYSVVLLESNWTCVSIEPAPGTVVNANDPVVVKVYKD